MAKIQRREFLAITGAAVAGFVSGCAGGGGGGGNKNQPQPNLSEPVTVFRLSSRGRRTSNAAKKHNANHLFTNEATADKNRAHKGDRSRIVKLTISRAEFDRLFSKGHKKVDFRSV